MPSHALRSTRYQQPLHRPIIPASFNCPQADFEWGISKPEAIPAGIIIWLSILMKAVKSFSLLARFSSNIFGSAWDISWTPMSRLTVIARAQLYFLGRKCFVWPCRYTSFPTVCTQLKLSVTLCQKPTCKSHILAISGMNRIPDTNNLLTKRSFNVRSFWILFFRCRGK